ncbi:hypothetical protein KC343_g4404 [Hortaea werneckii]|uniref:FAD/NAD(P)-binding domain-containing protein n=1 Tax=Hortaea werneckii TaxID=91943 RepID=A0A3M7F2P8_HORWE|nr:hypothetical protein KC323_g8861 [Hortaea werneckii]KAI7260754.1 hypothetical protein KC352_g10103 [Hortaea werneckii]KAI7344798.1 hypothetical protein KC320_g8647 [Hortaea werneckii]KAI7568171.1 hypothetical protein KC317_g4438 [Hortaea werneckii]KAI7620493.1 hypothetical protein KC346_g4074 [Hortaea werneckii]
MKPYEVAIVGSGPAGLSAALGLARVHRHVLVCSSQSNRNRFAPAMHNVLSRDSQAPDEFLNTARQQIASYGTVDFQDSIIKSASVVPNAGEMGLERSLFELRADSGSSWRAKKLVLATGVLDVFPDIPGYEENWGTNIYNCLFCEGHERAGTTAGILGFSTPYHLQNFFTILRFGCKEVHIFLDPKAPPLDKNAEDALRIAMLRGAKVHVETIQCLESLGTDQHRGGLRAVLKDSEKSPIDLGFLWHPPNVKLAAPHLLDDLLLEADTSSSMTLLKCAKPFGETNRTGVFVAGDASTPLANIPNAMASGSLVAVGAHFQLLAEEESLARAEMEACRRGLNINAATG